MNCKKCGEELYQINGLYTDRDGFREDLFCANCDTRWGSRSHGLVLLSEAADLSAIAIENKELKITIRQMMKIKEESENRPLSLSLSTGSKGEIEGCWWTSDEDEDKPFCNYCRVEMIVCPKEGHPNSKFWEFATKDDIDLLYVCPKGCLVKSEDE